MLNADSLIHKITSYFKKIRNIVIFFIIIIVLFIGSNSLKFNLDINFNGIGLNNIYVFLMILCLLLCCFKIEQIKEKTGIKIFDGTNQIYMTEEDLFREYYKLKNMINEIKNNGDLPIA